MKKTSIWFWIAIIILIVILLYLFTLGQVNGAKKITPEEFSEEREKAKHRHKRFVKHLNIQESLKKHLDKRFKQLYLFVRICLVSIWLGSMALLHIRNILEGLNDFLLYSQLSVLAIAVICFLTFGTITNVKDYIDSIKIRTENWVYGKYVNIDERIENTQLEINQLKESNFIGDNAN
jgi:Na+/H+ antiporter NhaC